MGNTRVGGPESLATQRLTFRQRGHGMTIVEITCHLLKEKADEIDNELIWATLATARGLGLEHLTP